MANSYAMGIDLGGSGIRCLLLNLGNGDVQHTSRPWVFPKSDDDTGLGYNIDLAQLWSLLGEASRELIAKAGINSQDVASVAVSAMRFSTVVINAEGEALFAAPNRDARASMEYFLLAESHGEQLLQASGLWPLPIQFAPRLNWLTANQPEVLKSADCIFSLSDWLNFRLSGVRATDFSQAGCSGLFDLKEQRWCDELINELGFDRKLFPEVHAAGTSLGRLSSDAAAHLGLSDSTQVGLGGGDTQCSLLAAGAVKSGDYAVVAGTTAPVVAVLDKPLIDAEGACWSGQHLLPERWLLESSGGPMGETLQWMARLLFPDAPQPELRLFAEAEQSEYGARGMLSSLGAEIMNAKAPSLPAGLLAMTHLSSSDDPNPRRHVCRAVVEGYAAAVRANIERLNSISGATVTSLHLTDGLSRSKVFAQLLADFCGRELESAAQAMTAATGAALCGAAAASGKTLASITGENTRGFVSTPDAGGQAQAQQVYSDWCALREAAAPQTTPRIADHMLGHVFKPAAHTAQETLLQQDKYSALVTASFDEPSLARLRDVMDVKYASFRESGRLLTGSDMVKAMQGKQILVTEIDIVDARALQQLPELRVVAACRGNAVNIDVDACTAFGVPVISAPGRNAVAVADITVAFILAQARKLTAAAQFLKDESVTAGNMGKMGQAFGSLQGNELWRKTIGLVGLGAVGRMVAERLTGFGARLIAADPFATPESAALAGVELVSLNSLLQQSDFVSLHAAVTPETTGMLGAAEFAQMKPTAFLINTARAALVDEQALIDAVQQNTIAGAALDTFDEEPPGWDHPLVQHPNVLSTPHVAGNTVEVAAHQGEQVTDALLQLLRGERPRNCLNPQVLEQFSFVAPRKTLSESDIEALLAKPPPAVTDLEKNKKQKARSSEARAEGMAASAPPEVIDKMSAILAAFCERMASDDKVAAFSEDKDVCLAFTAPDIGVSFYFGLYGGKVESALGENDKAEVMLTMRAEILNGMFSGSIDTMKAAMNGDIAFVGDAAKAMTINQLSRDMKRLYTAVIEELGSPGNLSAIPQPGKTETPAVVVAGPQDVRHELVDIVNELYEHYIITATGGNVSVRNPDNPDECWITPSQMFKGDLRPELMVRINLDGKPLDAGARSPSSEWGFHTQTLRKKKAANAVIHAHAPNATILANCGIPFLPISSDAAFFGDIQRIPFTMPGSNELSELVSEALRDEWAVFMVNHGIVVAGKSLRRACDMAQIIERTAEVILGCYKATGGKPPSVLPDEAVKLFRSMADIIA
ncbi:MAG TPA: hypothetical protein DIW43_08340 [Spongiibacteraceae bacterium]|nr:hypothetical protein [Spongiibacteraceae bacterium]HCS27450.1 hypothetical protein [Spongiibacteraceae bacterium]